MQAWIDRIHRVEDALLVILLSLMILLAATQILLRNFFDLGFVWADPLLRALVLWLGLIGATVATFWRLGQPESHRGCELLDKDRCGWPDDVGAQDLGVLPVPHDLDEAFSVACRDRASDTDPRELTYLDLVALLHRLLLG